MGYGIPEQDGMGCWWDWKILPPSLPSSPLSPLPKAGVCWKTVSSSMGLRTEISARYCLEKTRTDVRHLFCFNDKGEKSEEISIFSRRCLFQGKICSYFKNIVETNSPPPGNWASGLVFRRKMR